MSTLKKLGQLFSQKALRSLTTGVAVSSIMLGLGAFAKPASALTVGGIDLNPDALADQLLGSSGNLFTSGGSLGSVLLDADVSTFASADEDAFVRLGFSNPILNFGGNDLAVFEIGFPDVFSIKINNQTRTYNSVDTGFVTDGSPVYGINVVALDFSDFGVAIGDAVNEILIGFDQISPDFGTRPSLSLVAGIRSVPEPSAMLGLFATAGLIACQRKFKLAKKA